MKLTCTKSGLGCVAGAEYVIHNENKVFWFIIVNQLQKKVTKSTGLLAGAPNGGPSFELVTVTEIQLDLIPQKRGRGRPATGKALTPAEKQARYRARQAEKVVTVTFNRSDLADLKTLLANAPESLGLSAESIDRLAKAVFDAALS